MTYARVALLVLASLLSAPALGARTPQPGCLWVGPPEFLARRPSPADSLLFPLGEETAKVCYSRPQARGRTIFGELVEYGKLWRTGANEPTLLYLPVAAEVAGVDLEPGRYVLLTVPETDEWMIVLSTSSAEQPMQMLVDRVEVGRGRVRADRTDEHVEAFTIRAGGGEDGPGLVLEWERTRVRIPIRAR